MNTPRIGAVFTCEDEKDRELCEKLMSFMKEVAEMSGDEEFIKEVILILQKYKNKTPAETDVLKTNNFNLYEQ